MVLVKKTYIVKLESIGGKTMCTFYRACKKVCRVYHRGLRALPWNKELKISKVIGTYLLVSISSTYPFWRARRQSLEERGRVRPSTYLPTYP